MSWLVDPVTREPLPALPGNTGPKYDHAGHWTMEREDGVIVRMRWGPCRCDACEAEWAAIREGLERR